MCEPAERAVASHPRQDHDKDQMQQADGSQLEERSHNPDKHT